MLDAIKQLVDSTMLSEETRSAINEAWESKVQEIRESVEAEMRSEFAQRYEHDKGQLVEALNKMVSESLEKELTSVNEERAALVAERHAVKESLKEHAKKLEHFTLGALAGEIKEFKTDRDAYRSDMIKLENFVVKALGRELAEFATDKREVVEAKVKLVAEAKDQIAQLKQAFIKKAAGSVEKVVTESLKKELTQLKEDVEAARQADFGKRLFEAFAREFAGSHYSETAEIQKLLAQLAESKKALDEAKALVESKDAEVAAKAVEVQTIRESAERAEIMGELLGSLGKKPKAIMEDLLKNTPNGKLKESFNKYLPAVLNNDAKAVSEVQKSTLVESKKEFTGNKQPVQEDQTAEIIDIRKLAGLK
jgi:hypothetical protein